MEEEYGSQYFFVRVSEPRFCWRFNQQGNTNYTYVKNLPQSVVTHFFTATVVQSLKVACNSFCNWEIYIKRKSKITGFFQPTLVTTRTYYGSTVDSCALLYAGKEVILEESTDSLITAFYNKEF